MSTRVGKKVWVRDPAIAEEDVFTKGVVISEDPQQASARPGLCVVLHAALRARRHGRLCAPFAGHCSNRRHDARLAQGQHPRCKCCFAALRCFITPSTQFLFMSRSMRASLAASRAFAAQPVLHARACVARTAHANGVPHLPHRSVRRARRITRIIATSTC